MSNQWVLSKREASEKHLAGFVVAFIERGGSPCDLIGNNFKRQYDILAEALEALEWHEAAGRVRAWILKHRKTFSEIDRGNEDQVSRIR